MDNSEVLDRVIKLFAVMTEAENIHADSELVEDLDISSMDILLLVSGIEEEFSIKISEREIRKMITVGDVLDVIKLLMEKQANKK